mgnify:FL=1
MNKTVIKNFAVWARRKLISDITYKASMLGVTDSGIAEPLPISNDRQRRSKKRNGEVGLTIIYILFSANYICIYVL